MILAVHRLAVPRTRVQEVVHRRKRYSVGMLPTHPRRQVSHEDDRVS